MKPSSIVPPVVTNSPRNGIATARPTMPIPSQLPRAPWARRRRPPEPPSTNAVGSSTGIWSTGRSGGIAHRHGAREQRDRGDAGEDAQHRFDGRAEPHRAVCVRGGQRDAEDLGAERQQRHAASAQHDRAGDGPGGEHVVHAETERGRVLVAVLDRRELDRLPRPEQLPLAQHADRDDLGHLVDVVTGVVDTHLPPERGLLRLVARRIAELGPVAAPGSRSSRSRSGVRCTPRHSWRT